jgi:hypothetical protein
MAGQKRQKEFLHWWSFYLLSGQPFHEKLRLDRSYQPYFSGSIAQTSGSMMEKKTPVNFRWSIDNWKLARLARRVTGQKKTPLKSTTLQRVSCCLPASSPSPTHPMKFGTTIMKGSKKGNGEGLKFWGWCVCVRIWGQKR